MFAILIFVIGVAISEEVMIRGYLLPNIENGLTILSKQYAMLGAVIITSGLFALLHLSNPNVSFFTTLNTFLAGVWFTAAYIFTQRLGLAVGIHLGVFS
ncbi:CPBP family intramembrane glutamic endopeptidase [Haloquadratum walsbyi]|nr:CPBP family intramembrane glutamic endopeptidase [Haloquadratum walsbyi]